MNHSLKPACLSWDEAIRLDAVTEEHILEMQDIIIEQEGIIDDLETRVEQTERVLNSLDVHHVLDLLDSMDEGFTLSQERTILILNEIKQDLINFEGRK